MSISSPCIAVRSYVIKLTYSLLIGVLVPAASAAQQRTPPAERFPADLDRYVAKVLAEWRIPGLAIAVVRNDSTLVAKGYGVRRLGSPEPVDEHTVFDIASLAKSFTATAAAILVDRGRLRWDDPVRRHLPGLVLPTEELTATATVRDFLSHRSGLAAANMMWVLTAADRGEVLRRTRHLPVVAPLRREFVYSNVGYTVAGEAAAAAAGMAFEDLLRDLVIQPLGLSSTTWTYEQAGRMPNVASAHATIAGRQQPIRRETQRHSTAPAGAVQSSVSDLARWMRLHLNNGVLEGTRFVSDSAMRQMHSMQISIPTPPAMRARLVEDSVIGYGLGLQVMDFRGHPMLWHSGNGDGQIAYMAMLPRERLGIAVVVNTWSAPFVHGALVNRILDTYLGYEPRDWAAEALARVPGMRRAEDSAARVMNDMRSTTPPPLPLERYAGRYDDPLFGPILVRVEGTGLTFQMGAGQVADLEFHGGNAFLTRWRDPLYRENFGSHVYFEGEGDTIARLRTRINRDEFTASRAGPPGGGTRILEGVSTIDPAGAGRASPPASIVMRDGRIVEIYETAARSAPPGAEVLDGRGKYAIPGLVDSHVHLTSPFERPGQQDSIAGFLLRGGITAIRDMAGNGSVLRERARAAEEGAVPSPRIFYSTIVASPRFFATDRRAASLSRDGGVGRVPWQRSVAADSDAVAAAEGALAIGATGIKVYAEFAPALLRSVSREAQARGLKVWSHAAVVPARPGDAVAAGIDVLSHAFMLMLEAVDSVPGSYGASFDAYQFDETPPTAPVFARLFSEMRRRGTMLDPTLFVTRRLGQSPRVNGGDLSRLRGVDVWSVAATRAAHQAGVRLVAGTDNSGYPGQDALPTLHEELAIYVEAVGLSPAEALAAATLHPARMLGLEGEIGSIAPGYRADLVVLDANPLASIRNTRRIAWVIKGGTPYPAGAP
jgi:CubicO group peptidase (beta-lactamase class C family)/imidazolonepropionase-like amidohydrolase